MNVKQAIALLQKMPPDSTVVAYNSAHHVFMEAEAVQRYLPDDTVSFTPAPPGLVRAVAKRPDDYIVLGVENV